MVGLYLNPPQNGLVFCVDEKPCIRALERAQGWIRLPNGRALTGFAHEYMRQHDHALCSSGGGDGAGEFRTLSSPAQA